MFAGMTFVLLLAAFLPFFFVIGEPQQKHFRVNAL
jgi:hypothetical protein